MIWLVSEMWALLFAAFLAGGALGAWVALARRRPVEAPAPARGPAEPSVLLEKPDGEKDDLTQIIGVDAATETRLNAIGVYHFAQVASWDDAAQRWVEIRLNEPGRVSRERWTEQALTLV